MKANKGFFWLATMSLSFVLAACGQNQEGEGASTDKSVDNSGDANKVYLVGCDASYAPFEFLDQKQVIQGFDADLLSAVAARGGFRIRFVNTPWEGIFSALAQGDRDILASAITITDERKQSMNFSSPYFEARQLIAVTKGRSGIRTFYDLKGKRVAVQTGTTGDEVVQKLKGRTASSIKRFESMPLALKELENGGVDAVVGDNGVVANYVRNNPQSGVTLIEDKSSFAPEYYGFAVRKDDRDLLVRLNAGIAAVRTDGTYDTIYKKYFGDDMVRGDDLAPGGALH